MQTDRQDYTDGTYDEAILRGYDTVSLKFDGWWCRLVVADGAFSMYSRTSRLLKSGAARPGFTGTFVGEYMFGTNWAQKPGRTERLYLFDCWGVSHADLSTATYRDRFMLLKTQQPYFPDWMEIIPVFPIGEKEELWKKHVEGGDYEGVVYRRKNGSISDVLMREKKTITKPFRIIGFEMGEGKHTGRLGALLCNDVKNPTQTVARVGNGFSDAQREEIWQNQSKYMGKIIECSGKALFEATGLLRHPTFERVLTDDEIYR